MPGRRRTTSSALWSTTVLAVITASVLVAPMAGSAVASDSMTYTGLIGLPRHTAPESVAVDASGNVYVAELGALNTADIDQVTKYTPDGVFLDVIVGPGTGAGEVFDPTSIAIAPSGDLYVVDKGNERVQRFDSLGNYLGGWGARGDGNGQFKDAEGIAVDSLGNVYVADSNNFRIQKFDSAGNWLNAWPVVTLPDTVKPLEIAIDSSDVVYVVGGTAGAAKVRRFDSDGVFLSEWASTTPVGVAIDGDDHVWVSSTTSVVRIYDNAGLDLGIVASTGAGDGQVASPQGMAAAPSGQMYVADTGNQRIQRFSATGVYQTQWGHYGAGVMDSPTGIAVDADDNVYVTNQADDLIQKFAADGSFLLSWGGTGTASGQMKDPSAIAIDPSGFVYVADKDMQRIQKFDLSGNYLMQWGSFGTANGQMKSPQGIAVDGGGHVFVADTGNHRIQKFTSNGVFMTSWGGLTQGTGNGQFRSPSGIGIDADGDVWVADSENNRLQQFTATGTFISKVAGTGVSQLDGKFDSPSDIDFDSFGTMYVVDRDNARVQRLSSDGAYISKFGDGGLDVARFSAPGGVVVDSSGRVLVADSGNHRVQTFIDANGPDTTVLTGPAAVSSSTSASFTFAANEPDSTYECKMDNGAFEACTSGKSYVGLAPGPHAFSVRATDALLNVGDPNTYPWTIDVTPPGVSITGGPALLTASTGANFSFEATEDPVTFRCSVDAAAPVDCVPPYSTTVTAGDHTFSVYAIDQAGNTGQPATYSWTMDNTPPSVNITSGPSGITSANTASFGFTSGDPAATFECQIDGLDFAVCTSPKNYSGLAGGQHTFSVRAADALGNLSAPAQRNWTVDAESHRPDAQIGTGTTYVGDGVYNSNGTNQTKTLKTAVGATATFKIRIENDGSDTDSYTLSGPGSANGYTITYLLGTTAVTNGVVDGTYKVNVGPGSAKLFTLKVKVGKSAAASKSIVLKATSGHAPSEVDAIKAIVKRS